MSERTKKFRDILSWAAPLVASILIMAYGYWHETRTKLADVQRQNLSDQIKMEREDRITADASRDSNLSDVYRQVTTVAKDLAEIKGMLRILLSDARLSER